MENLQVTAIEQLIKTQTGELVKLPNFENGQEFCARLKKPTLSTMLSNGCISGELIVEAQKLFIISQKSGKNKAENILKNPEKMKKLFSMLDSVCEACFVEPTFKSLKEKGIALTEEQLFFVFKWSQKEVSDLKSFRS